MTQFWKDQRCTEPPVVEGDLTGKTVIVTGANTGLGFEATKHFARMGAARLILGCRNTEKGEAAVEAVKQVASAPEAIVECWYIDQMRMSTVIDFANKFKADGGRLDILVCNAGITSFKYEVSPDGYEAMIQVNHLSTALLSVLLLPTLQKTAQDTNTMPRLVIVSSAMHYWAKLQVKELQQEDLIKALSSEEFCTAANMKERYQVTKLFNVLFTRALTAHVGPSFPVVIDTVDPGFCYSSIRNDISSGLVMGPTMFLMEKLFALTTEVGSRQLVYAALAGKPDEMRGQFVSFSQTREVGDFILTEQGKQAEEKLWANTVKILSDFSPDAKAVFQEVLNA
ncbi:hypothetical protein BOTBODRAFT_35450 [Botryobasidium botryosum FD-172 SS1]|uniref:Ketoreductase (KR) domain-containing protein n=1 Tax=Botryobasidium botryosum (strain FD-172 SS1) TaxID=930990 RepID=A0A067M764_BOTB1|nr:hypothetical protein BOTBODRAFT_35450 [Botryobasidium botryosum FD-172 SS1]